MKKVENGRSMVEMLGVLAIIGVLSVGGIAGYKMAMERHELNEMLNEINIAVSEAEAISVQPPKGGKNFSLEKGKIQIYVDVPYYEDIKPNAGSVYFKYYIGVSGISTEACQAVRDKKISFDYLNPVGWAFSNGAPMSYGSTVDANYGALGNCSAEDPGFTLFF